MTTMELLELLNDVQDTYILEAQGSACVPANRSSVKRSLLIAAAIVLALLLVGCTVVYALSLRDLKMGQSAVTRYEPDPQSNQVTPTERTMDVISLQGIQGSPNFLAAKEWFEFEQSYDPERQLVDNAFVYPSEYDGYSLYNQEMADKVTEICEKYSLKPLGKTAHMQSYQFDVLYEALGIDSLFRAGIQAENGVGYFTEYGNFNLTFQFTLTGEEAQHKGPIYAAMRYVGKDYFDTMNAVVDSIGSTDNWNYTLTDGTQVLLIRNEASALILCDQNDAFLSVFLEAYDQTWQAEALDKRDIELAAEGLNFTVNPQRPDMAQADRLLAEAEQAYQESLTADDPESYAELLETRSGLFFDLMDPEADLYYTLTDINADGIAELLLSTSQDSFGGIFTMADGKAAPVGICSDTGSGLYLCEDGFFESPWAGDDGAFCSEYYKLEQNGTCSDIVSVGYDAADGYWCRRPYQYTAISQEEALAILASHPRVELDMKPVSEFPEP